MMFSAWGALAGLGLSGGVLLTVAGVVSRRRHGLIERLEPYLSDSVRPSSLLVGSDEAHRPGTAVLATVSRRLDRVLGNSDSIADRLQRAGLLPEVEAYRVQQVLWGITSAALVAAVLPFVWWARGFSVAVSVGLLVVAAVSGVLLRDHWLSVAIRRREAQMVTEFPALAELLALAVTAGEGIVPALERVCRRSRGAMAIELQQCLADTRSGLGLREALERLARRTGLPTVRRFVDGLVVAVDRGTPLADVLRAQAQDAREAGRQHVIEIGGKREIAMLVPVIFLVLPITVLFAVYPGFALLRLTL